jgi:hypothetical protein
MLLAAASPWRPLTPQTLDFKQSTFKQTSTSQLASHATKSKTRLVTTVL